MTTMERISPDEIKFDANGLIPAICQHHETGHGDSQEARPSRLAAPGSRQRTTSGHDSGPQHRWLEPGDDCEESEEQQGEWKPPAISKSA